MHFIVKIVFIDGDTRTFDEVTVLGVRDGVLHLHHDDGTGGRHHLGSFPLANIRSWQKDT